MNTVVAIADNPSDLLSSDAFGTGALVRFETSTDLNSWSEIATAAIVAGTYRYEVHHLAGTSASYYRTRYSKASPSVSADYSAYSPVFLAAGGYNGSLNYTTSDAITLRMVADGAAPSSQQSTNLDEIATWVNDSLEQYCQRPIGPSGTTARTYDGDGTTELWIPEGLSGISTLKVKNATGGTLATLGATEYVLRPASHKRPTGWPAFYIKLTDLATTVASFTWGYDTVEVTPDSSGFGWPRIPVELQHLATTWGVRLFQNRQGGEAGQTGSADFGASAYIVLTDADYEILNRYRFAVAPTYLGGGNW